MDILIKNMEMPKEMECVEILLFSNGHCSFRKHERDEWVEAWAVALPEHERLGDLDALLRRVEAIDCFGDPDKTIDRIIQAIENAPTIVEANE